MEVEAHDVVAVVEIGADTEVKDVVGAIAATALVGSDGTLRRGTNGESCAEGRPDPAAEPGEEWLIVKFGAKLGIKMVSAGMGVDNRSGSCTDRGLTTALALSVAAGRPAERGRSVRAAFLSSGTARSITKGSPRAFPSRAVAFSCRA